MTQPIYKRVCKKCDSIFIASGKFCTVCEKCQHPLIVVRCKCGRDFKTKSYCKIYCNDDCKKKFGYEKKKRVCKCGNFNSPYKTRCFQCYIKERKDKGWFNYVKG